MKSMTLFHIFDYYRIMLLKTNSMDAIKKELEENNSPFDLSCVKVELIQIKHELVKVCFYWSFIIIVVFVFVLLL